MKIPDIHRLFLKSSGISTDTRKIKPGTMFFALKGTHFDGNKFAVEALNRGAVYSIVDRDEISGEKIIPVPDVLTALQELAAFHREYLTAPIIALTGSNGKTTTKELIKAVLSKKYNVTATQGNLNNHIGVPLSLLSMHKKTEIGIVEMGANHLGEIAALCKIARPDFGYITNFGKAHLEGFGSVEGVIKGKSELYAFLKNNNKTIFINTDDPLQIKQSVGAKTFRIGENENQDCRVEFSGAEPFVKLVYKDLEIQSQLIGKYNFRNIAAAIGIGDCFEVPSQKIKTAIEAYLPANNRSQIIEKKGNKILLDAYNANPTSMHAALENFASLPAKKKVLILGDMFELGKNSLAEHQAVVDQIEANDFANVYLCGKNFHPTKTNSDRIKRFECFEELKKELLRTEIFGSFVLIKGSRGMALERVLEYI